MLFPMVKKKIENSDSKSGGNTSQKSKFEENEFFIAISYLSCVGVLYLVQKQILLLNEYYFVLKWRHYESFGDKN